MSSSLPARFNQHAVLFEFESSDSLKSAPITAIATIIDTFKDPVHADYLIFKISLTAPWSEVGTLPAAFRQEVMLLKLYHPRFARYLRDRFHLGRRSSVSSVEIITEEQVISDTIPMPVPFEFEEFDWTPVEGEAENERFRRARFDTEVCAYKKLQRLQGSHVPTFFGSIYSSANGTASTPVRSGPTDIPGILMEYVPSFPLSLLDTPISNEKMAELATKAVELIRLVVGRGVLHRNVSLGNFLVKAIRESTDKSTCYYQVFMIDFSDTYLQREDEIWDVWKEKRWKVDQEGVVGSALEQMLESFQRGLWKYDPVYFYMIWEDL
ncbi:hypothetical protein RUND412_007228 [Rhizina undulata]